MAGARRERLPEHRVRDRQPRAGGPVGGGRVRVPQYLRGSLRFDEAYGLLRYLDKRGGCRALHAEYDGMYPEVFYPDHPWRKIGQG